MDPLGIAADVGLVAAFGGALGMERRGAFQAMPEADSSTASRVASSISLSTSRAQHTAPSQPMISVSPRWSRSTKCASSSAIMA